MPGRYQIRRPIGPTRERFGAGSGACQRKRVVALFRVPQRLAENFCTLNTCINLRP
jgi:hypothetical protein